MKTKIKIKDIIRTKYEELRSEKNLTICSLAKKAEMEKGQVYRIVNGETRNPRVDTLSKIAKGFGITLDELNQIYANLEESVDSLVSVNNDEIGDLNGKLSQNSQYELTALIRNIDGQVFVEYQAKFVGYLNELTPEKVEEIQARVSQLAQSHHQLVYITEGSIIIGFEGDLKGFQRIESLFKSGELKELAGFPVLDVKLIAMDTPEEIVASNNDPIAAGIAFLESNDPVAVQVRERLENRLISEIVAQLNAAYPELSPDVVVDILVGSVATGETKRGSDDMADTIELLELAIELADKLAEIWGDAV
jgi:transcriptional regulator with XRE-family HTH domain